MSDYFVSLLFRQNTQGLPHWKPHNGWAIPIASIHTKRNQNPRVRGLAPGSTSGPWLATVAWPPGTGYYQRKPDPYFGGAVHHGYVLNCWSEISTLICDATLNTFDSAFCFLRLVIWEYILGCSPTSLLVDGHASVAYRRLSTLREANGGSIQVALPTPARISCFCNAMRRELDDRRSHLMRDGWNLGFGNPPSWVFELGVFGPFQDLSLTVLLYIQELRTRIHDCWIIT